jgi:hypothetical protein
MDGSVDGTGKRRRFKIHIAYTHQEVFALCPDDTHKG